MVRQYPLHCVLFKDGFKNSSISLQTCGQQCLQVSVNNTVFLITFEQYKCICA